MSKRPLRSLHLNQCGSLNLVLLRVPLNAVRRYVRQLLVRRYKRSVHRRAAHRYHPEPFANAESVAVAFIGMSS